MTDIHSQFQDTVDELSTLSILDKILFLELLLFSFTVSARGIWSNEELLDQDKVEAFKWLNELNHRIWNIRSELKDGMDNDSIIRLYNNMKFYGEQSTLLQAHLVPTLLSAFKLFKNIGKIS